MAPAQRRIGVLTSGGDCAGLNAAIRAIVHRAQKTYGWEVLGIEESTHGLAASPPRSRSLSVDSVHDILAQGGTILGTSRGRQETDQIVDCLERMGISILFVIGGDGSLRGAMKIAEIVGERNEKISVVGIPKTIDNDIPYIDQSFGFQTAFSEAVEAISSAHVEAKAAPHGVGQASSPATRPSPATMPTTCWCPRFRLRSTARAAFWSTCWRVSKPGAMR